MHIRFMIDVTCEDQEPSRVVPRIEGKIFDFVGEDDEQEVMVGRIGAYLVQVGRALNEEESLFDAMDSINQSVHDCYCALFNLENDDEWSTSVLAIYGDQIASLDVLYIESIDLEPEFTSIDVTAIVRETIDTFGSNCGLVAHEQPQDVKVWTNLGFRKLPDSDFYVYAPDLLNPTASDEQTAPSPSVSWANRVPRGRRRRFPRQPLV